VNAGPKGGIAQITPDVLDVDPEQVVAEIVNRLREVVGQELRADFTMSNPDQRSLPIVFGTHPYFQLSLGGGRPEEAHLTVPASTFWELEDLIPTGKRIPVNERNDLRDGRGGTHRSAI